MLFVRGHGTALSHVAEILKNERKLGSQLTPTGAFEAPFSSHSRKKLKESANPQPFAVVGGGSFYEKHE